METGNSRAIDLDAYLERIRYTGERRSSAAVLDALHQAHATQIPFENLDILLGRSPRLDLDSLQAKLVRARRGGYCFEQNLLFAAALEMLGFPVTPLAARVRLAGRTTGPRTHMLLLVDVEKTRWVADVGFGSHGLLSPVPLEPGILHRQGGLAYTLRQEPGGVWVLECDDHTGRHEMYGFTLEPQLLSDYEVANHYTATHPDSIFTHCIVVQRLAPPTRYRLTKRELITVRGSSLEIRIIANDEELLQVLADVFGLAFPPGTRFRYESRA